MYQYFWINQLDFKILDSELSRIYLLIEFCVIIERPEFRSQNDIREVCFPAFSYL